MANLDLKKNQAHQRSMILIQLKLTDQVFHINNYKVINSNEYPHEIISHRLCKKNFKQPPYTYQSRFYLMTFLTFLPIHLQKKILINSFFKKNY